LTVDSHLNVTLTLILTRELFTHPLGVVHPLLTLTHIPKLCSSVGGVCVCTVLVIDLHTDYIMSLVLVVYSYTA